MSKEPQQGDLRIWHIPQVPGKPFHVIVKSADEAKTLLSVLADYDAFQLAHNIKGDYCNVGGIERFEDGEWCGVDEDELWEDAA